MSISAVHFSRKWVILFEEGSCGRPFILSKVLASFSRSAGTIYSSMWSAFFHKAVPVIHSLSGYMEQIIFDSSYFKNSYFFGRLSLLYTLLLNSRKLIHVWLILLLGDFRFFYDLSRFTAPSPRPSKETANFKYYFKSLETSAKKQNFQLMLLNLRI